MIIEWKEKYRVGIDIIDEQHKKFSKQQERYTIC